MSESNRNLSGQEKQFVKMTQTPVPSLILKLGIPTTISMLITSIYNMADTFFVGKYGTSASGAIGVVFGLMAIIQAFGFMFGQGSGSICSRALGAKDTDKASKYASTGFASAFISGLVIMILGIIFIEPLVYMLGSTETILPYAKTYTFFILLSAPFMCAGCVMNNLLRYEGQAFFAMIGLGMGGLLNIFGDWLLMSKFHLGVMGAGISTAVSQTISFCILISVFLRGKTSGKIAFKFMSLKPADVMQIVTIGFPSLVRQGLTSVSTMMLNKSAGIYGDAAVAAMSIVNRICFFTFACCLGIGQGFQPVSAFNYGAKKYDRVRKAFFFTWLFGEILLGITAIVGFFFAKDLVSIFRDDAMVVAIGAPALMAQFAGQIFQPFAVCTNMMFQSVGKTKEATFMSVLRSGLFFIPALLLFTKLFGLWGVQYTQAISDVVTCFVSVPFAIHFLNSLKVKQHLVSNNI